MMPDSLSTVVVTALKLMVALSALSIGAALLWLGWLMRRVTVEDAQAWEQARIGALALPAPLDVEDVVVLAVPPLTIDVLDELRTLAYEPVAVDTAPTSAKVLDTACLSDVERDILALRKRYWQMTGAAVY